MSVLVALAVLGYLCITIQGVPSGRGLGFADMDLGYSTILRLQQQPTVWPKSQGTSLNLTQPNAGSRPDGTPCTITPLPTYYSMHAAPAAVVKRN